MHTFFSIQSKVVLVGPKNLECFYFPFEDNYFMERLPTDDNLHKRGIIIVSVCSNCGHDFEMTHRLFLSYPFACQVRSWVESKLGNTLDLSSLSNLILIRMWNRPSQASDVVLAAITFTIFNIWTTRNELRFEKISTNLIFVTNVISSSVHTTRSISSSTMVNSNIF